MLNQVANLKTNKRTQYGYCLSAYPKINTRSKILHDKALLLCSSDVLPRVVIVFVPVDVLGGLVLVGTG